MATTGIVLTALGTVTLAVTAVLLIKGAGDHKAAISSFCADSACASRADALDETGHSLLTAGTLTGLVTGALLGSGIPLYVISRQQVSTHGQSAARWTPQRIAVDLHQVTLTYAY